MLKICWNGFSKVPHFLERFLMEHIELVCSSKSQLFFVSKCSIRICSRTWVIVEKLLQCISSFLVNSTRYLLARFWAWLTLSHLLRLLITHFVAHFFTRFRPKLKFAQFYWLLIFVNLLETFFRCSDHMFKNGVCVCWSRGGGGGGEEGQNIKSDN